MNFISTIQNKISKFLLLEWLNLFLPIIVFAINIVNMILSKVLYNTEKDLFTYINDISNSLGLTALYFISYFLSVYYPSKFDEFIKQGIGIDYINEILETQDKVKESKLCLWIIRFLLICSGVLLGYLFYNVSKGNKNAYWMYHLSKFGRVYYCFFLGITWYHSLTLLGMASSAGMAVYWCIRGNHLKYVEADFNKNASVIKSFDILICTFSYGLFYILGAILMILNDNISTKYKVYNAFSDDLKSLALIMFILFIVVFEFIPLKELFKFMKNKKESRIAELNSKILHEESEELREKTVAERNDIIVQDLILTSLSNKIILFLSIVIPLLGVIFQGIDLFN